MEKFSNAKKLSNGIKSISLMSEAVIESSNSVEDKLTNLSNEDKLEVEKLSNAIKNISLNSKEDGWLSLHSQIMEIRQKQNDNYSIFRSL